MPIKYDVYKDLDFKLPKPRLVGEWIKNVIKHNKKKVGELQYIFCTDLELLDINLQFLNHDYFTDIITFDYSIGKTVAADIYISLDRIKENAQKNKVIISEELHRVMIHGILHLIGFKDKKAEEKQKMRLLEDKFLKIRTLNLKESDIR
jgi:probable rRNA maturation factor